MAYKPEKIARTMFCAGSERRARRDAKKASTRLARRAAKRDPENAPTGRIIRGYID